MTKMHVLQYTKVCQCVLLDIQFHFHFHENAHPLDSRRIQCCGVGSSSNDPSSVGRERTMEGCVMYEGMESSDDSWKTSQIIALLSDWTETTKRHNETVKRQTITNRCGRWWVELAKTTSRRGQPTKRIDKTTRQTPKQMSRRILKTASRTGNSTCRTRKTTSLLEVSVRKWWNAITKRWVQHFVPNLPSYFGINHLLLSFLPCISLTLYTVTSVCIFSILLSNQELH